MNLSLVVNGYKPFLYFKTNDQGQGHIYIILYADDPILKNLHTDKFGHILKTIEYEVVWRVWLDQLLSLEGPKHDDFPA